MRNCYAPNIRLLRSLAFSLAIASFHASVLPAAAATTPVSAHIAALVEDGTIDARRVGDAAPNRARSAQLVAERIDELSTRPASRADVETMRRLVDALKDELDAANIRIDRLEQRLNAAEAAPAASPIPFFHDKPGAPLDPLAAAFAARSRVAVGLWGLADAAHTLAKDGSSSLVALRFDQVVTPRYFAFAPKLSPSDFVAISITKAAPSISVLEQQPTARPQSVQLAGSRTKSSPAPSVIATQTRPVSVARAERSVVRDTRSLGDVAETNTAFDHAMELAGGSTGLGLGASGALAYPNFQPLEHSDVSSAATAYRSYAPSVRGQAGSVTMPITVGRARITTKTSLQHIEQNESSTAAQLAPVASANRSQFEGASVETNIVVPAFHKDVTIHVQGGYDNLHHPDTTALPYYRYDAANGASDVATIAAGSGSATNLSPSNSDVQRYTYGASAAVPVTRNLNVGVGYSSQHLSGTYGAGIGGGPPADRKDAYTGSLTYAPGSGRSSVTVIGREYRYSDDSAPNANIKQTRGDVLFSVKF